MDPTSRKKLRHLEVVARRSGCFKLSLRLSGRDDVTALDRIPRYLGMWLVRLEQPRQGA